MSGLTITLSQKQNHLVFMKDEFEDGFSTGTKTGIVKIDSKNFDPEELLEKAKTMNWEMSDEPDNSGFYPVRAIKVTQEGEQ